MPNQSQTVQSQSGEHPRTENKTCDVLDVSFRLPDLSSDHDLSATIAKAVSVCSAIHQLHRLCDTAQRLRNFSEDARDGATKQLGSPDDRGTIDDHILIFRDECRSCPPPKTEDFLLSTNPVMELAQLRAFFMHTESLRHVLHSLCNFGMVRTNFHPEIAQTSQTEFMSQIERVSETLGQHIPPIRTDNVA